MKLSNNQVVGNANLAKWIEEGLDVHNTHNLGECMFCGNKMTEGRLSELESHFNENFKDIKQRLNKAKDWLSDNFVVSVNLPDKRELYDEFQNEYSLYSEKLIDIVSEINSIVTENWIPVIEAKLQNPFEKGVEITRINVQLIYNFNDLLTGITALIHKNNVKNDNFENEVKSAKKKLEMHYCYEALNDFEYFKKAEKRSQAEESKKLFIQKEKELSAQIMELEKSLSGEVPGASQFNDKLGKFLGHREIALEFDQEQKGYRIIRSTSGQRAFNLSESEKTAIAFVYFITKLKEHGNILEDSIVVVDDPVSNLDSNHLFHAYSFLKEECGNSYQLFVFTHNLFFFRLVRDWLISNNKMDVVETRIYSIDIIPGESRKAEIRNANFTLVNYQSEIPLV
jgi:wobble nucleotide-excising tRNase